MISWPIGYLGDAFYGIVLVHANVGKGEPSHKGGVASYHDSPLPIEILSLSTLCDYLMSDAPIVHRLSFIEWLVCF